MIWVWNLVCRLSRFSYHATNMNLPRFQLIAGAIVIVMLLSASSVMSVQAQAQPSRYFPETGHTVAGEFLSFFNARGGLKIFGYPITDAFDWNGRRIQYFQRARMELHPENPFPYRVQLGLLGDELGHRDNTPAVPVSNDPYRRYFPETKHVVAYAFLDFYDSNGGLDIFGYPITDFTLEPGQRIVQYFQRARFEWHPELSGDQRVQLGDLGTIHFDSAGFDPSLKRPTTPGIPSTPTPPISLRVAASVRTSITPRSGDQTLYVYVTDQTGQPIASASVTFIVRESSGNRTFTMPPTDTNGYTSYTFDVGNSAPGRIVVIQVNAAYLDLLATAQTSYLPWY